MLGTHLCRHPLQGDLDLLLLFLGFSLPQLAQFSSQLRDLVQLVPCSSPISSFAQKISELSKEILGP